MFLHTDAEILADESIINWYEKLDNKHILKNEALNQLVEWVKQPSEDSDEASEGGE